MSRFRSYVRQHHVGLIAILLILTGGTAYAVTAPKNSVASSSIKNGAVTTKDVKDSTLRGSDVKDGDVTASDLAPNTADTVEVVNYGSGDSNILWQDPNVGTVSFSITCTSPFTINSFASLSVSPGKVGVYGVETHNAGGEPAGAAPLVGAATVSRDSPAQPVGGAGFGGTGFGMGRLVFFYETPTKNVHIQLDIITCSARGTVSTHFKGPDSTPPLDATPNDKQSGRRAPQACETTGAAYCAGKARRF